MHATTSSKHCNNIRWYSIMTSKSALQTLQHLNSSAHQVTASARDANDAYAYAAQMQSPLHFTAINDIQFYMQHLINYCKYIINQMKHLQP